MVHPRSMHIEERHLLLVEIGVAVNDGPVASDILVIPVGCMVPLISSALPRVLADALRAELSL